MHAGLERWPAPSSPVLRPAYLPTYPDILLCPWLWLATHSMHIPCLIHANGSSSYNRRCRQFKATTLAYWRTHLERNAPHRTRLDLTSPHSM